MVMMPTVLDNFTVAFKYLVPHWNTRFAHEVHFEVGDATTIRDPLAPFFALVLDYDTHASASKT